MYGKKNEKGNMVSEKTEYTDPDWLSQGVKSRSENYDRYDPMMASFARIIRGEAENPVSPDYELELYRTVLKCCGIDVKE